MDQDSLKKQCAQAALQFIEDDMIVGVGTGSTVNYFIDALATLKHRINGTVSSSKASSERLKQHGIPVYELNTVDTLPIYVDGADEINDYGYMIKGGGGAHTCEKIVAATANQYICIADSSKHVKCLGEHMPLPIEVLPIARSYVGRQMVKLGGNPAYREHFTTDNNNIILDVYGLDYSEPLKLEQTINNIPGVVESGLFAHRSADIALIASERGVKETHF